MLVTELCGNKMLWAKGILGLARRDPDGPFWTPGFLYKILKMESTHRRSSVMETLGSPMFLPS